MHALFNRRAAMDHRPMNLLMNLLLIKEYRITCTRFNQRATMDHGPSTMDIFPPSQRYFSTDFSFILLFVFNHVRNGTTVNKAGL